MKDKYILRLRKYRKAKIILFSDDFLGVLQLRSFSGRVVTGCHALPLTSARTTF